MPAEHLDLITVGRAAVDFYGEQIGSRLEDMTSFAKYLGGCPANIAVGAARLGLDVAVLTRVGDEHMGRFVRETLAAEGVDVSLVKTDPRRLTGLVVLGIKDAHSFPLIFFRQDCADMGIEPADCDPEVFARAGAVLVTGTHFSRPGPDAASRHAIALGRKSGARIILDIDYRPVLWGLTSPGLGEERFVADRGVSAHLQTIVPECDLVVGTEEEIHIAGGSTDTMAALRRLRELTRGLLVVKRGPMGCAMFPGDIPATLDDGIQGPGFPVEVYNVLGAGDAFMSGFLRGWLRGEDLVTCARYANACGALVVARHSCAPAIPTWSEMQAFIARSAGLRQPRLDAALSHHHHAATRRGLWDELCILAVDHRVQFTELAARFGRPVGDATRFKAICCDIVDHLASTQPDGQFGLILDELHAEPLLHRMTGRAAWLARCIEVPRSRPLQFVGGPDVGVTLRSWPAQQVVKCLVSYHADDPPQIKAAQDSQILRLYDACRATAHELLLEIIPPQGPKVSADEWRRTMQAIYDLGVKPDWWKLPGPVDGLVWEAYERAIEANDKFCRGVLLLGLDAPMPEIERQFNAAAGRQLCRGFAIGRTIWWTIAERWFAGEIDDAIARQEIERRYHALIAAWRRVL
jgi:5-dehydro-2-deoxygluconokinase